MDKEEMFRIIQENNPLDESINQYASWITSADDAAWIDTLHGMYAKG